VLATDADPRVRRAAAQSVLDLDEVGAAQHLLAYFHDDPGGQPGRARFAPTETWDLYRDHLVEALKRRDKAPERVLDASELLVTSDLRPYAVDLLRRAVAAREGLWDADAGRGRVRERLADLLLLEGEPAEAETLVLSLLATDLRDEDARARWELLLARSLVASGRHDKLREARRRLEALRASERLPARLRPEVVVELGDCLLRLDEPAAALLALEQPLGSAELPTALAKRLGALREQARKLSGEERERVRRLVEGLAGAPGAAASPEACLADLRAMGPRAAAHLLQLLEEGRDPAQLRRLLRATEVVSGRSLRALPENANGAEVDACVAQLRDALARAAERAGATDSNTR
jgi:hypothetical protein